MNILKFIRTIIIISFFLLLVLIGLDNYLNFRVNNSVLNVVEYKNIDSNNKEGITFGELNKVKKQYGDLHFTGYSEINTNVTNKYDVSPNRYSSSSNTKEIKTKIVLTDEIYFVLYPFKFISGGKLDFLSVEKGDKVAIISDVLANALFKSNNIIGSTIKIKNKNYKIAGVYEENKSLLYSEAEDNYDRVYIPYSSYDDSSVFLNTFTTIETKNYDENSMNNKLSKILADKLLLYKSVSYTQSKKLIFQIVRMFYFIIGILLILCLIKILVKLIKEMYAFFTDEMKYNYLKGFLLSNRKILIIFLCKIVIIVLSIFVIFKLIRFNLIILDSYLPSDNIFDISFYKDAIITNMQLNNGNETGFSNVYNRYLSIVLNTQRIMFLFQLIFLVNIIINYKIIKLIKRKPLSEYNNLINL